MVMCEKLPHSTTLGPTELSNKFNQTKNTFFFNPSMAYGK